MIPSEPVKGAPSSEQHVFRLLAEQLDDSWTVLHSVPFIERERERAHDGEIDFVLLHPQRGVMVLEVKGGRIDIHDGRWTSTDRNGEVHRLSRSPFDQCRAAKYALREVIEGHLHRLQPRFVVGHAVIFPSARQLGDIGADGKRQTIWDVGDLHNIEKAINGTLGYLGSLTPLTSDELKTVVEALRPTETIGSRLQQASQDSSDEQLALTERQIETMAGLRGNAKTVILGGAGTGKTVLAIEHAKWLAEGGKSVGVFCFNEALGTLLASTFAEDGTDKQPVIAGHIHGFMEDTVVAAGLALPPAQKADGSTDPEYYRSTLPDAFVDAAIVLELRFDALVIDEGQDFHPDWLTRLELLLDGESAQFHLFADDRQNLYVEDWKSPVDTATFTLSTNCRNTEPIAALASKTIGRDEPVLRAASGLPPQTMPAADDDATHETVRTLVQRLVQREHFAPSQIAVLTQRKHHRDTLRGTDAAGTRFVTFDDADRDGVLIETIHKFKGLETDVAIVLLDGLERDADRALAYVGMSRAKTVLFTVAPPEVIKKLNAPSEN